MKVIICMLFITSQLWGQIDEDPSPYLQAGDSVVVYRDSAVGLLTDHHMERKQTLYSLSRFYGLQLTDLYVCNPIFKDRIVGIGDRIKVPVDRQAIFYDTDVERPADWIGTFYAVQPGDNLFRIARIYFNTSVDHLRVLNDLTGTDLQIGQLIQVGWIGTRGIDHQVVEKMDAPEISELAAMDSAFNEPDISTNDLVYKVDKGIAMWNKELNHVTDLYALHREAPVHSVIELINPFLGKKVFAKVIAPLPSHLYPADVKVVVSPAVANLLGAVDSRFYVKVRYLAAQ